MPIRVLQVIPTLVRGGAEKQCALLAAGLPAERFESHVAVLTHTGPLEADLQSAEVPVHHIHKRWKLDPFAYGRLKRLIQELKPDIVHTWLFAANCYGRAAALACKAPVIIGGERSVDPWKRYHELALDRWFARRSTCLTTNSSGVVDFYASKGLPPEKFVVIPNGVALPDVSDTPPRATLLQQLGLPADAKLIAAVGRLWPQKRIKDLIWAADLLKCVRDDVHLLVIGEGPQRWRLEQFRRQCQIEDRVHFLGERNDVLRLLPHCECLWLGSGYEGQSNAILEAMSVGLPVIASDIPGNRDLVVPEQTGYLFTVGDRAGLAKWTKHLLEHPELAKAMGAAGRQRVAQEFSIPHMIARHAELYERLTAR
jgi:glycosyltransferase involved in cell wall biosynthesis